MPVSAKRPKVAYLWGEPADGRPSGSFVKLPAGFAGEIHSKGAVFHGVVVTGQLQHQNADNKILGPGSYFSSKRDAVHQVSSIVETIIYVRTNGRFNITDSTQP